MKKIWLTLFFLCVFILSRGLLGQENSRSSLQEQHTERADLDLLFNNIVIQKISGQILSGILVGLENTSLVIRVAGKDERIPLSQLGKVTIEKGKNRKQTAFATMLLSLYIGNFLALHEKSEPTAYLERTQAENILVWNAFIAGAGAGLGLLIGPSFQKDISEFDFKDDTGKRYAEWEQMRRFIILGESRPKKFHLSIQSVRSYIQTLKNFSKTLEELDFHTSQGTSYINILRKAQLTFSLNPSLETGIAVMWLGEPSFHAYGRNTSLNQWLDTTGYYTVGIFEPFHKMLGRRTTLKFGAGLGAARVAFRSSSIFYGNYTFLENSNTEFRSEKTHFSGIVFTEFSFHMDKSLSLGLIADYVYIPDQNIGKIYEGELPAQTIQLQHGSIGITFGLHF